MKIADQERLRGIILLNHFLVLGSGLRLENVYCFIGSIFG